MEYPKDYKEYIEEFLKKYSDLEEDYIYDIINNETNKKIYISAITDIQVNPNNNYEDLEFLGDRLLKAGNATYLFFNFPNIENKKKVFSEIQFYLDSDVFLSKMADLIGIKEHIIHARKEKLYKLYEDVFEAFIGSIYVTIEKLFGGEMASSTTSKIIHNILKEEDVSPYKMDDYLPYRFKLDAYLIQFGLDSNRYKRYYKVDRVTKGQHIVSLFINNEYIATGYGKNKGDAINNTARDSIQKLTPFLIQKIKKAY